MNTSISTTMDYIEIKTDYMLKELCKAIPSARWNPTKKVWYYPKTYQIAKMISNNFKNYESDDSFEKMLETSPEVLPEAFFASDLPPVPNTKMESWNHQKTAFWFAKDRKATALFMDMGTGKSKVVIDILNNQKADKVLIICPLSVVNVWNREFERHGTKKYSVIALNNSSVAKKTEKAKQHIAISVIRNTPAVVVINYESIWRPPFDSFAAGEKWDSIILDESHRIKAPGGKASRFLAKLGKHSAHRMILTGTPMPHNPGDLYAQYRFLDPAVFGTSFMRFKNEYAVPINQYEVAWTRNSEELSSKMYSVAFRVTKDILDLPEAVHVQRECVLEPKTFKMYSELEKQFYVQVENGEVTTTNALTKLLRLQQIANGFVKNDENKIIQIDSAKQNLLSDIIEDIAKEEKIVVFSKFINDLDVIKAVGKASGRRCGEISGRQKDLTSNATFPDNLDLLAVQMQAGGVGIDLSKARFCIYFSVGFSLGDYEQSLARVHRPGQLNKVFYVHMISKNTVDEKIYMALQHKKNIINAIINKEEEHE